MMMDGVEEVCLTFMVDGKNWSLGGIVTALCLVV